MKSYPLLFFLFISAYNIISAQSKVSLLFAGDAMQHKSQLDAAKIAGGYDYSDCFSEVRKYIEEVDIAIVNFETTLPGRRYSGYPMFGSPDEFAVALKDAGFDIFLTSNNHCVDKGKKGLERTIQVLDSLQIKHLGTYVNQEKRDLFYPMMVIKNGIRIALLNYTYGLNGLQAQVPNIVNLIDRQQMLEDIRIAKYMKPDIIIANMHWGDEYWLKQNKEQEKLADFLIKNGVRLVIGSHPHVVQPIDIRKSGGIIHDIVVYSLGNFISAMKRPNTDGGMMVRIDLSKSEEGNLSIDNCNYSLVWVYKSIENGRANFKLLPVQDYNDEENRNKLGQEAFEKMQIFSRKAEKAIESMW